MDITLALGGGGSKGNAHIGVLRQLEQKGFRVKAIAGTSYGGLVAVFYALGCSPDEIEEIFASADQTQFYGHAPNDGPSLVGIAGVTRLLEEQIGDRTFADLKIPCVLTSVDLKSGKEVLLSRGRLVDAMLATIAIPGIFPARYMDGLELVDGGTLDPVPVAPARDAGAPAARGGSGVDDAHGRPAAILEHPVPQILGWDDPVPPDE